MSTETETTVVTTADAPAPVVAAVAVEKKNIPADVFVRIYNASATRKDAIANFEKAGYTLEYGSLIARAKSFIKKGVHLKSMPRDTAVGRKGKTLDVAKLNAVADAVAQELADAQTVKNASGDAAPGSEAPAAS